MITIAGAIIQDEQGKILLLHRNVKRIQWELPGGKVESGETEEETAVREIKEELGIDIELKGRLGNKIFIEDEYEFMHVWFAAETTDKPKPNEDIFDSIGYFSAEEINAMYNDCSDGVKSLIEEINSGRLKVSK